MKPIALLAAALFLASAPSPDSATISQLSAGFLVPGNAQPLLASEAAITNNGLTSTVGILPAEESHDRTAKQVQCIGTHALRSGVDMRLVSY